MTDTTMAIRKRTLNYGALLIAALGMLVAWLAFAPPAGAQGNSGADQYLENVPNPSGEKPGDKDNKGGGGKNGSGGNSGSSGSNGSGSSGKYGQDETEDALADPGRKAAEDEKKKNKDDKAQADASPDAQDGDRAAANVPSAAVDPPDDGSGGGLSGGVIAFIVILLLGPVAFLLYRRVIASRRGIDTA